MNRLSILPDHLIQLVLGYFQTSKKFSQSDRLTEYEMNRLVSRKRKNLINGSGIKTDLRSIVSLSGTCQRFNYLIKKSNVGKLVLAVHIHSKEYVVRDVLQHISYCNEVNCTNVCHYVNKDIKYSDPMKRILSERI